MRQRVTLLAQSLQDWPLKRKLLLVGAVALLLRLPVLIVILMHPERAVLASDAQQYLRLADNLRTLGIFTQSGAPPYVLDTFRTPGYPLFILPLTVLFGPSPLRPLIIMQMLLGVLTSCGVYLLACRLFDDGLGLLAGLVYAVLPMPIIMAAYAYSETLFSACLVGGALLLVMALDDDRWPLSLAAGLIFGFAVLVRPIAIWLLPVLILFALLRMTRRAGWRHALIVALSFMLLSGAWMTRNLIHFNRFSLSSISGNNLFYYNVAGTEARRLGIPIDAARHMLEVRRDAWPGDSAGWPYTADGAVAREVILEHPLAFAVFNGLDALNGFRPGFSFMLFLFVDDPAAQTLNIFQFGGLAAVVDAVQGQAIVLIALEAYMVVTLLITMVGMLIGIGMLVVRRRFADLVLLAGIPAVLLYLPGIASNARFRAPAEVFLVVLMAWAFSEISHLRASQSRE